MSQTNDQLPQVAITDSFMYKGREVQRIECSACGKCALIPTVELGSADQDAHMLRGNMCANAILAASETFTNTSL